MARSVMPFGMLLGGVVIELSGNNLYAIFLVMGVNLVIIALVFPASADIRKYLSVVSSPE